MSNKNKANKFCLSNPCLNNGSCYGDEYLSYCYCPSEWFGEFCEQSMINLIFYNLFFMFKIYLFYKKPTHVPLIHA